MYFKSGWGIELRLTFQRLGAVSIELARDWNCAKPLDVRSSRIDWVYQAVQAAGTMIRKERSVFRIIGKSIGEVRGFRRTESSRMTKRSECFFNTANLQKNAELKSLSGMKNLLFNFALHPAFCQYNVSWRTFYFIYYKSQCEFFG